jgi:(2R)-ethylmalonyl-CoA mutase
MDRMAEAGLDDVILIVGGIIPEDDSAQMREWGVSGVYTPKDFRLNDIMHDIFTMLEADVEEAA